MEFIEKKNSIDCIKPKNITIVDVDGDGACLYRCMVNFLCKNSEFVKIYLNFQLLFQNTNSKIFNNFLEGDENEIIEKDLAKKIQELIRQWVEKNIEDQVLINLIDLDHEITIREYINLYKIFAGEPDYLQIETGEIYKRGRNKGKPKMQKIVIQDRWGGFPELYIFSKMFNVNVSVYTLTKKCPRTNKVKPCTIRSKDATFTLLNSFIQNNLEITANFLLLRAPSNKTPHYQLIDYLY
jgi:hypothetical protein